MSWDVLLEDQFTVWLKAQEHAVQVEILANIKVLKISGSNLGRPYSDTLKGSRHSNMKELRVQCRGELFALLMHLIRNAQQLFYMVEVKKV